MLNLFNSFDLVDDGITTHLAFHLLTPLEQKELKIKTCIDVISRYLSPQHTLMLNESFQFKTACDLNAKMKKELEFTLPQTDQKKSKENIPPPKKQKTRKKTDVSGMKKITQFFKKKET